MKKRLLSIILTVCMVMTLLPTVVLAASDPNTNTFDISEGDITIENGTTSGTVKVAYGSSQSKDNIDATTQIRIIGSSSTYTITVKTSCCITLADTNITPAASSDKNAMDIQSGTVNLTLADGTTNTLAPSRDTSSIFDNNNKGKAALRVDQDAVLIINGSTGTLIAEGGNGDAQNESISRGGGGAGIGGNGGIGSFSESGESSGKITINGGVITATGGFGYSYWGGGGAGIGGGGGAFSTGGSSAEITINGGFVSATGGNIENANAKGGTGIGGGGGYGSPGAYSGSTGLVSITGGTVYATGAGSAGHDNSGIGTEADTGSILTITGGSLKAAAGGDRAAIAGAPTNGQATSAAVQLYTLTVNAANGSPLADTAVTALTATDALGYTYGMTDVKTDADGKLYVYLPASKTAVSVTAGGVTYTGSVISDAATLMPSYAITAPVAANGSYTVTVGGSAVTSAKSGDTVKITPTANSGYVLDTVSVCKTSAPLTTVTVTENSFTMPEHAVTVTVTFQATVSAAAIAGVTAPVAGGAPVGTITECDQYTGTVTWRGNPGTFASSTVYTATITLTPKTGYTLAGITEDFFKVAGANTVTYSADSGEITAIFPATGAAPLSEHHGWSYWGADVDAIGFNYGDNKFINITMPTTVDYYTYGTAASNGTAAEIASNAKILPASGWNWAVQKHAADANGIIYTLTLNGFDISSETTPTDDGLMFTIPLNLVLYGENSIYTLHGGVALSGFYSCDLHISGTGSLTATGSANGICCQENITITGGTIDAYSTTADGIASGSVTITGGTVTAQGGVGAFNIVPTLSNVAALASTNDDGSGATAYNSADNDTYKWFRSAPGTTYTVTFVNGGGTGTNPTRDAVGENYTFALPANPYTRNGFTFAGWNNGTNTYQPGATYTMPANNVTFTAQWTQNAPSSSGGGGDDGTTNTGSTNALNDTTVRNALGQAGTGNAPTVTVPTGSSSVTGQISGRLMQELSSRDAVLEIKTNNATYSLPTSQINIGSILGNGVTLSDVSIHMDIHQNPDAAVSIDQHSGPAAYLVTPIDFNMTCVNNGNSVEINRFTAFVQRDIVIPNSVNPVRITTGVVIQPDGTLRHVPTTVFRDNDGRYFARINSLTNSTYSVIYNPVEFTDVADHWAKASINNMGSRLVISGIGDNCFAPNRDITRAEFSAIVVRALGLPTGEGDKLTFTDVSESDWSYSYIQTAVSYGLISGYNSTTFGGNDKITREQAITIIARAMKITKLADTLKNVDADSQFKNFSDASSVSDYAKASLAACLETEIVKGYNGMLNPKTNITRAETAVIVERLLTASGLI